MKIFWNGIGFPVPDDWEMTRIGKNRLCFQQGERPVVDVQWRRGSAPVDFPAFVEKWKRECRKKGDVLSPILLPKDMPQTADVHWNGFEWKNDVGNGIEILRHCHRCQTVTVFRWTVSSDVSNDPQKIWTVILPALAGFSDHETGSGIRFALYDIALTVPEDFHLERFAFHPGLFELQFRAERGNIRFLRWAAATELLRSHSLESLGERVCGKVGWSRIDHLSEDDARVGYPHPQGWFARILPSRNRSWCFIRYDRVADRILVVYYRGRTVHTDADILRFGRMFSVRPLCKSINHLCGTN
ncbi:MAG: hypothetical protein AB1547_13520 [Thermodesulfobacteriota bacterium]